MWATTWLSAVCTDRVPIGVICGIPNFGSHSDHLWWCSTKPMQTWSQKLGKWKCGCMLGQAWFPLWASKFFLQIFCFLKWCFPFALKPVQERVNEHKQCWCRVSPKSTQLGFLTHLMCMAHECDVVSADKQNSDQFPHIPSFWPTRCPCIKLIHPVIVFSGCSSHTVLHATPSVCGQHVEEENRQSTDPRCGLQTCEGLDKTTYLSYNRTKRTITSSGGGGLPDQIILGTPIKILIWDFVEFQNFCTLWLTVKKIWRKFLKMLGGSNFIGGSWSFDFVFQCADVHIIRIHSQMER